MKPPEAAKPMREKPMLVVEEQITQMATLYAANTLFTRESTKRRNAQRLATLRQSYEANLDRYRLNSSLVSFFDYLFKLANIWLPDTRDWRYT